MKITSVRNKLLVLFISITPLFWFPIIGKVLFLKMFLLLMIIFLSYKKILFYAKTNIVFLIIAFLVFLDLMFLERLEINNYMVLFFQFLTAWVCFILGEANVLSKVDLQKIFLICSAYCSLILIFFALNINIHINENWYYEQYLGAALIGQELPMLNVTGWGFGRTQWSTCLSQFVPLFALFFMNKEKYKYFAIFLLLIIFATQIISGGRGGIVTSLIVMMFMFLYVFRNKMFSVLFNFLLLGIVSVIIMKYGDFFRIYSDDISAHRVSQYRMLFHLLSYWKIFGLGFGQMSEILRLYGYEFSFHNSIIKIIFELGIVGIIISLNIFYIAFQAIKRFFARKGGKPSLINLGMLMVLVIGLIASLLEPTPIISSDYWALWWLSAGYSFSNNIHTNIQKVQQ